jgi:hypothetical protein
MAFLSKPAVQPRAELPATLSEIESGLQLLCDFKRVRAFQLATI